MFVILCYCIIDIKIKISLTILIVMLHIAHKTNLLLDVTSLLNDEAKNIRVLFLHYQWNIICNNISL